MDIASSLLMDVEAYVTNFIAEQVHKDFAYHNIQHTLDVVTGAQELGDAYRLNEKEIELLLIAAWFHDVGYDKGPIDHEDRSANYAQAYLSKQDFPEEDIVIITSCIMATKMPQAPKTILEKILCDADMSHLGKKIYWDRCGRIRQEITLTRNTNMSEQEWVDFELDFISKHHYHTPAAKELYDKRKHKHIRQLNKQKIRLNLKPKL